MFTGATELHDSIRTDANPRQAVYALFMGFSSATLASAIEVPDDLLSIRWDLSDCGCDYRVSVRTRGRAARPRRSSVRLISAPATGTAAATSGVRSSVSVVRPGTL